MLVGPELGTDDGVVGPLLACKALGANNTPFSTVGVVSSTGFDAKHILLSYSTQEAKPILAKAQSKVGSIVPVTPDETKSSDDPSTRTTPLPMN